MAGLRSLLRATIRWATAPDAARGSPTHPWWYSDAPQGGGHAISPDAALSISAVYRAVDILANSVAQVPLIVYRRNDEDDGRERATKHPLYRLLKMKPNPWQSSFEWRHLAMCHVLLRGNAYSFIDVDFSGQVVGLYPMLPWRMKVDQLPNWRRRYTYTWEDGRKTVFTQDQILHLHGLSSDGLVGLSPVTLARVTMGAALAREEYGARQFSQAPKIAGVLEVPGLMEPGQRDALQASFRNAWSGANGWFGVPVLDQGMKWSTVGMSNEDAEFLASRKFDVVEIARWFGVPPHKLSDLDRATFSNIEHSSISYVMDSVLPWYVRFEQRFGLSLFPGEDEYFAEFLVDGLLRGDGLSRSQKQEIYLRNGVLCPNEVRAQENLNAREGGDEYLIQVNATRPMPPGQGGAATAPRDPPHPPEDPRA